MIGFWILVILSASLSFFMILKSKECMGHDDGFGAFMSFILVVVCNAIISLLFFAAPYHYQKTPIDYNTMHVIRNKGNVVMYNDTLMRQFGIAEYDSTNLVIQKGYTWFDEYVTTTIADK
jgi:hypothetical protein